MYEVIEHTDLILGRTFVLPCFDKSVTDLELIADYQDVINDAIYSAISILASEPKWEAVPCFLTDDVIFEVRRDKIDNQYGPCLSYYQESEEYEICSDLVRLYDIIKK